jgi:hypothetical protein
MTGIIAAARCDHNEVVFISRDVARREISQVQSND